MFKRAQLAMHEKTLQWAIERYREGGLQSERMAVAAMMVNSQLLQDVNYLVEEVSVHGVVESIHPRAWNGYASHFIASAEEDQRNKDQDGYFVKTVYAAIFESKITEVSKPKFAARCQGLRVNAIAFLEPLVADGLRIADPNGRL